ncbi:flagellar protein FliS [Gracilibacillus halotolerans]|uniref:Flagellar secretion chaperone FliS n=1 Tax=Gracilibacillus halotolerans TaxID=74386 RepID=A0A841RL04_9BACI|nr:flagellar export chaperone FliS [Gracilibacillus halotolerans]MBB6512303.1 flagellar protein FliS [Gracilibacillus halotolerans]
MAYQPYQAYKDNSVNTATPGELTLMLYNGCLSFIKQAKKAIETENFEKKNEFIQKSQNIIRELMVTLDQDAPIAKQMLPLYDFAHHALTQGNIQNDTEQLTAAEDIMRQFRDTWKDVVKQERIRQHGQGVRS